MLGPLGASEAEWQVICAGDEVCPVVDAPPEGAQTIAGPVLVDLDPRKLVCGKCFKGVAAHGMGLEIVLKRTRMLRPMLKLRRVEPSVERSNPVKRRSRK